MKPFEGGGPKGGRWRDQLTGWQDQMTGWWDRLTGRELRLLGLGLCLGSGALSVLLVGLTVYEVRHRQPRVSDPSRVVSYLMAVLIIGLILAVGGERAKSLLAFDGQTDLRKIRPGSWLVLIAAGAAVVACLALGERYLKSMGYTRAWPARSQRP